MKQYFNGDEMRRALAETLKVGDVVLYCGIIHTVIDAGPVQGLRIAHTKRLDTLGHSDGEPYDSRIEDR